MIEDSPGNRTMTPCERRWMTFIAVVYIIMIAAMAYCEHQETLRSYGKGRGFVSVGLALEEKGDIEGARANYLEALAREPNNSEALCNLAILLWHDGYLYQATAMWHHAWLISKDTRANWPAYANYHEARRVLNAMGALPDSIRDELLMNVMEMPGSTVNALTDY